MKKSDRVQSMVEGLGPPEGDLDACYTGWFTCFNRGDYYEAHDVLEHLWLTTEGPNHIFYKGLIQLAGAFVHLKKQHARPWHAKDGARLRPASRLFQLARKNVSSFVPHHQRLDVAAVVTLCDAFIAQIARSEFRENPWAPDSLPIIELLPRDPVPGTS